MPNTTQSSRVMMPPSYFGARASIATAWHWVGSPVSCTPRSSSSLSTVPRLCGVPRMRKLSAAGAPVLLQPLDVGFEAAAGRHEGRGAHDVALAAALHGRGEEHAVVDVEIDHLGVVFDLDAEILGGEIERVEHRAPAAEEERIGAPEAQGAAERGLVAHALLRQPVEHGLRFVRSCGAPAPRRCGPA